MRTTTITMSNSGLQWTAVGMPGGLLDRSMLGAAGGVASLDTSGKVPGGQVPSLTEQGAGSAAMHDAADFMTPAQVADGFLPQPPAGTVAGYAPVVQPDGTVIYAAVKQDGVLLHRGPWAPGTAYAVNDVVTEGGGSWVCTTPVDPSAAASYVGTAGMKAATPGTAAAHVPLPAGVQVGDYCVLGISGTDRTAESVATALPTGFTVQLADYSGTGLSANAIVATKTLDATDVANGYVATLAGFATTWGWAAQVHVFRNVSGANPSYAIVTEPPTGGWPNTPSGSTTWEITEAQQTVPNACFMVYGVAHGVNYISQAPDYNSLGGLLGFAAQEGSQAACLSQGYLEYAANQHTLDVRFRAAYPTNGGGIAWQLPIETQAFPATNFRELGTAYTPQTMDTGAGHTVDDLIAALQAAGILRA